MAPQDHSEFTAKGQADDKFGIRAKISPPLPGEQSSQKVHMALVLCTGTDDAVMETRKLILERAGHTVLLASDDRNIEKACTEHDPSVVVIGQNTSPAVKLRHFQTIQQHCKAAKILELHRPFSERTLDRAHAWLVMPNDSPEKLVDVVNDLAEK